MFSNHFTRMVYAFLGTECLPAFARTWLMRRLGFDIARDTCIWANCSFRSRNVKFGSEVFINYGFFFDGSDLLVIGNKVRIGQFVRIITSSHVIGPASQRCTLEAATAPVRIEDGCWIGSSVTILPGVTVRQGCVIAACSLVTTTTEPNGLYAGTPARRIKDLPV